MSHKKRVRHGERRRGGGLPAGDPAAVVAHALTAARQSFRARLRQEVRRGARALRGFQVIVEGLLAELRAGGPPAPGDVTIGAHLLRMHDPATGRPLTDAQLLPEARPRPPPLPPSSLAPRVRALGCAGGPVAARARRCCPNAGPPAAHARVVCCSAAVSGAAVSRRCSKAHRIDPPEGWQV